jgi:hypothetical protein
MKQVKNYLASLTDPRLAKTAVQVALVIGSLLFTINHGAALVKGEMTKERWISAGLTYLVPYAVNIHGQFIARSQRQ